ncbi:hypothetical protein SB5439_05129 [Klebsiella variicola]|uniref:DUF3955 domain-containing protein n=1 Tax=Klebsiella variicola TaxID=244366 RepID=UPI00109C422D|nr:DUF3955 domain-containing protein [Klebsiella variicola]VGQ13021.1 hypothetical protein SB5439_05129 [Klebsiella variicola]
MKTAIAAVVFSFIALICFVFYYLVYPPYVDEAGILREQFGFCAIGVISMMVAIACIVATLARKVALKAGDKTH